MVIYTLGYEGATADEFLSELEDCGIECLVDVRELPLSRKKGFSKTALALALEGIGVGYLHLKALGCPRDIRRALARNGDWESYLDAYCRHLSEQADALQELLSVCLSQRVCLLCFEADAERCHRSLIASALSSLTDQTNVRHLRMGESRAEAVRHRLSTAADMPVRQ